MEPWVFGVGLAMGAAFVASVCFVWVSKHTFGTGGAVMSFAGVLLIGLSVFKTANLNVGSDGVSLAFEARLKEVADNAAAVSQELTNLSTSVEANQTGILGVLSRLEDSHVVDANAARALREPLQSTPKMDRARLNRATEGLSRISAEAARRLAAQPDPGKP